MTTPRELGRRSIVAVLIVIAAAVAILGVLVTQTSQLLEQVTHPDAVARLEYLVTVEASCVVLLLSALGLGMRHAVTPAYQRLQRTVDALEESESRNRAVLDAMGEGMLLTDASGRILAWNRSAQNVLGLDPAANETASLHHLSRQLIDEKGVPRAVDDLPSRITLRTGKSLSDVVMGVRDEHGGLRWISVNTHPIFRANEEQAHAAVSIFRDISVQRRADEERAAQAAALETQNRELTEQKEALERGQALYRSLVDTAGSAIVGVDRNGVIFEWNREAENLYGISRAEAIGRDYMNELVTPRYRERMREGMTALLSGKTIRNVVAPLRSRDGQRRSVLWNMAPLRAGPHMPVHGVIAVGLDITERDASDERFRVLFERSSDAHLLYDDNGIIDCNDATLRLLRYSSKDSVLGKTAIDLSPRRQPDGRLSLIVGQQMRQLARLRGYNRFEWVHQRADGSVFPVEVTLTPVRLHGREVILAVWHDISEQKKVEDALRAAKDAAESANRTKSEFMTRMNHELRTPLTAIIGFSRVLMQGKEGALSSGARNYVERIRVNGMHLLSLINQILDVAKVEAGRMELEFEPVQVDALVREILGMLEPTAESKGLAMRGELPPRVAPYITDVGKLRQILINLVGNAVKFTNTGEVCVRVQTDPITGKPVAIHVQDTGIGIPRERQDKVFEPFEQGDSSTRREFGGTGLGLAIVKTFAELIGARVQLESEVGKGTTFTLHLAQDDVKTVQRKASA